MNIKGLKYGDITQAFTADLYDKIERVINAKSKRRDPYYLLIQMKQGYGGPLAMGNNNELLHGKDTHQKRRRGPTKTLDMSEQKVGSQVILVLEPWQVPNIPLISCMLLKIDNRTGQIERLYALPPDLPCMSEGGIESEVVAKSAQGMPIVYGAN